MIKSILVPIDTSPSSQSALRVACSFAGLTDAKLYGLYVEDQARFVRPNLSATFAAGLTGEVVAPLPLPPEEYAAEQSAVQRERDTLASEFRERCQKAAIDGVFQSQSGDPRDLIAHAAKTVDFVVIGNAGRHLNPEDQGITVDALLHATVRPVMVVPDEPQGESTVVMAYDGGSASERTLRFVAECAEVAQFKSFHLLSVGADPATLHRLQEPALKYLSHYDLEITPVALSGKPEEVIVEYAQSVDASVVALGAFGSNRLAEAIFGSTTSYILREARQAVFLVP